MTTPDPDPETQAAIAETLRLLAEARQAPTRRRCAVCYRLYPAERVTAFHDAVICRECTARGERR